MTADTLHEQELYTRIDELYSQVEQQAALLADYQKALLNVVSVFRHEDYKCLREARALLARLDNPTPPAQEEARP